MLEKLSGPENHKGEFRYLTAIFLISAVLVFFSIENGHSWGDDFALYIRQAKSLVEGNILECMTSNAKSMAASDYRMSPDLYPWGLPLLLAPVYYFFGMDLFAMKLPGAAFFYASLAVVYLMLLKKTDRTSRLLIISLFAFNAYLTDFMNQIFSDMPGLFFCLLSIFMIERFVIEKAYFINKPASFFLIGVSLWSAHLMRPNYILLLPALFICQMIDMRKTGKGIAAYLRGNWSFLLPYIAFLLLNFVIDKALPRGDSYDFYKDFIAGMEPGKIAGNIYYTAMLPIKFFSTDKTIGMVLYLLTVPFAVKGLRTVWRKDYLYVIFFVSTALFFAFWPGRQGLRYIFSLLPFYMYFLMVGLKGFSFKGKACGPAVFRGAFSFLMVFFLVQTTYAASQNMSYGRSIADGPFRPESAEMIQYIREHSSKKDVIIFFKPRAMALMTDRDAFFTKELSNLAERGDYLVINKKKPRNQVSIESDEFKDKVSSGAFVREFENNGFVIYRIKRPSKYGEAKQASF